MMSMLFVLGFDLGGFQLILLRIAEEYELSYAQMSLILTIKSSANFICVVLIGPLSDRVGKTKVLRYAAILYAAGCILEASSRSLTLTYLAAALMGMPFGLCEALASAVLADEFPKKQDQMLLLSQGFFSLGAVLGPLYAGFMLSEVWSNWRIVFLTLSVLMAVLFALMIGAGEVRKGATPSSDRGEPPAPMIAVRAWMAVALILSMLFYAGMENGVGSYVDTILDNKYALSERSAFTLSGFWLAMLVSRVVCAMIKKEQKRLALLAAALCCVSLLLLYLTLSGALAVWMYILLGAACGPVWPLLFSFTLKLSPERTGTLSTLLTASNAIGASVFPLLMGRAADSSGSVNSAVGVALGLAVGCAVLLGLFCLLGKAGEKDTG